jgi:hypothetical protein
MVRLVLAALTGKSFAAFGREHALEPRPAVTHIA